MRPFLSVDQTRLDVNRATNQLVATIRIHHSGLTPAQNVNTIQSMACIPVSEEATYFDQPARPQPLEHGFSRGFAAPPKISTMSLGPGNSIQRQMFVNMDAQGWSSWAKNKVRGWVFGIIVYSDEFGTVHATKFRFYHGLDLKTNEPTLLLSDDGNDSN